RHVLDCDVPTCARTVVDNDGLIEILGNLVGQEVGGSARRPAGRSRHHDTDGLGSGQKSAGLCQTRGGSQGAHRTNSKTYRLVHALPPVPADSAALTWLPPS